MRISEKEVVCTNIYAVKSPIESELAVMTVAEGFQTPPASKNDHKLWKNGAVWVTGRWT
jgi:hypothetical protein